MVFQEGGNYEFVFLTDTKYIYTDTERKSL